MVAIGASAAGAATVEAGTGAAAGVAARATKAGQKPVNCKVLLAGDALEKDAKAGLESKAGARLGTRAVVAVRTVEGRAVIEVSDDGPGIPDADLPYVFDRFHRSPDARSLPGSGLGLAIAKQVAESHGGRIEAVPQPVGVLLRITLPAAAAR